MTPTDLQHWDDLDRNKFRDERETVAELLAHLPMDRDERADVLRDAVALVDHARLSQKKQGVVESFLQEFSLGTREGLALMCLAEALLRTPDADTRDRLIAEKIGSADWASHLGQSDSLFVNASTWGLMLTGKLVDVGRGGEGRPGGLPQAHRRASGRAGHPSGGGHRRQDHGRAVRGRPHHRGRAEALGPRGLAVQLRHAGRGRPHRRRRRAL